MTAKKDIDKFNNRLFYAIKRALNKGELTAIAKIAISIISKRTRGGFGVKQAGGNAERLKKLSSTYVEYRKRSDKLNRGLTTPGKSNLTFTGKLLESLTVKQVNVIQQKVFINGNRRRRAGGKTNEDVAGFVSEQGREFLNLSRRELEKVAVAYRRNLVANLKKQFD